MKLNDAFPSNYLKSADLQGRTVTVTISKYAMEKLGDEQKLILHFLGKEKGMVCNRTNATLLAFYYGEDLNQWIGKSFLLGTEPVTFQGKVTEALRVKGTPTTNAAPAPALQPAPVMAPAPVADAPFDDEIPF
ncbi:hypothetical protein [Mesorhizobium sp. BR-1-1-10]|uniref:hypothetical protein n=1 Tax=Mesorhizobium sp. BR-1-1-10 TaxID=2876660 RepID=UPI001CD05A32|nr:hypothetical protein [Mesorhizobium sp. BR-1-1-10]MBZ9975504.1 hypothetical protein [Mesorhizobium sp. BR-1-1-10]